MLETSAASSSRTDESSLDDSEADQTSLMPHPDQRAPGALLVDWLIVRQPTAVAIQDVVLVHLCIRLFPSRSLIAL